MRIEEPGREAPRRPSPVVALRAIGVGRWARLLAGIFVSALGSVLMIRSGLGLGPWDAFHVGMHLQTGLTVGAASIAVGVAIVIGLFLTGVRPGVGTLANMVLIGVFMDLLLPVVPALSGGWPGYGFHLSGIVLVGVATALYLSPGLGAGPRDGLMLVLAERTGRSVQLVRTLLELAALLTGWAMGGTVGIGTILVALGIGPVTQRALRWFGVTRAPGADEVAPDLDQAA